MADLTIISGGQTGVDTAAIKAAIALKIPYRGWVPNGFTNEVGMIAEQYHANLRETPSPENAQRTEWNMRDADIILTILRGPPDTAVGGTKLGVNFGQVGGKSMYFEQKNLEGLTLDSFAIAKRSGVKSAPSQCSVYFFS